LKETVQRIFETGKEGVVIRRMLHYLLNSFDKIDDKKCKLFNRHREV
jgi:hypothetical protein